MIDFDTIDNEIIQDPVKKSDNIELLASEQIIKSSVDLVPFIESSDRINVICRKSAENCLSMSLQARKMKKALDKSRSEIIKPHIDFQKAVNKISKDYENKLEKIEKNLTDKVTYWLENQDQESIEKISVIDGSLSRKEVLDFEVVDVDLIPREFLSVDEKKISEAVKNGMLKIDGVRVFTKIKIDLRVKN